MMNYTFTFYTVDGEKAEEITKRYRSFAEAEAFAFGVLEEKGYGSFWTDMTNG